MVAYPRTASAAEERGKKPFMLQLGPRRDFVRLEEAAFVRVEEDDAEAGCGETAACGSGPGSPTGSCGSPGGSGGTPASRHSRMPSAPSSARVSDKGEGSELKLPAIKARTQLVGPAGRGGATRARLTITVMARFAGVQVSVDLAEGELDRGSEGFPESLPQGEGASARFRSSGAILGTIHVSGLPPIPFGTQAQPSAGSKGKPGGIERINFVSAEHRQRSVVAGASNIEMSSGLGATGDGTVAEVVIGPGSQAEMTVTVRKAKKKELTRLAQEQALVSAMDQGKYSNILAQITRSQMRKVPTMLIDQAKRMLKSIQMPEGSFLSHQELGKLMKWKRVSSPAAGTSDDVEPCPTADCHCNEGSAQSGEVCSVTSGKVQEALDGVAPSHVPADKWLFQALVKSAMAAPEGCVWKSGGKFLLTNEERNQSPTAIVSILEREGQDSDAGKGIRALVDYTQKEYGFRVTAVQLNFHPNHKSSHKQHRDIYGAGQKGGINCTCSFLKCQGTVCFSLGSARQIMTETMIDKRSKYEACGEECKGCKTMRWCHSGSAMFFNDEWNNNHSHGVPSTDEKTGPRISVALLCA